MKTVKVPAELEELENVREFADRILTDTIASDEDQMAIELAIEEVFVNIVKYAGLPKTGQIMVSYEHDSNEEAIVIQFEDEGRPFNPLKSRDPDVMADLSDRVPGGLGIYMLKSLMDKVEYEYVEGMNRLVIWKKLSN
ncbi:MAG: ATP-binding protein [Lachnospiraceae bacterium]|nr:ATP-binding protein [Lachnospiraceae bacterium]